MNAILTAVIAKADQAEAWYGPFASTHEALGVALEEWDELRAAIHANNLQATQAECIDLAAVLVRLARDLRDNAGTQARSLPERMP